ncbi:long-chain fatty acid--CoA ligase [Pelagibius sp. Alg239-R121]|uniref:long-chain-fatty-acid--CoA ligase n=1 Tax=Pelagibius sp. Alg239-R121 TaxID=2993448 RepID=UPI0024A6E7CC|nr:long-chain fatty acid--CoA ligase [Pelagibius sp. Alg239-R121]
MTTLSETAMPWAAKYPPDIDWHTKVSDEPMPAVLDRQAAKDGSRNCINFLGRISSYGEVAKFSDRMAKGLQALGVGKGDRVGLFLPNTPYAVIAFYGVLKAGGIVVNFNPLYADEEVRKQIDDSGVKIMITLDLKMMLPKLQRMLGRPPLEKIVVCSMSAALPFPQSQLFRVFKRSEIASVPNDDQVVSYESVTENDGDYVRPEIDSRKDIAVLQYTGGTTGLPKGAMLTHANIAINARQVSLWDGEPSDYQERVLGVLPLFHVFAMTVVMNASIVVGAEMILLPRFDVITTLKTIQKNKPTQFPGVPTLFNAIDQEPTADKYDLSSINICISGGAPLPVKIKQAFENRTGCKLVEGYGLSECSPVAACNPVEGLNKEGGIGLPLPETKIEIRALDDPDKIMPSGESGEVCVVGPQVMAGYWNRPDETARTIRNDRLHTGDIGYMDEDGFTFIIDRLKDMIICSGYNVYPRTIEEAIYRHPAVAEVTVVGIPDDYRGEAPKAFIRLKDDHDLEVDDLKAFLKDKISPIEMPQEVEFRDELPKTMIGKLSKKELVAEEHQKRAVPAS